MVFCSQQASSKLYLPPTPVEESRGQGTQNLRSCLRRWSSVSPYYPAVAIQCVATERKQAKHWIGAFRRLCL